MKMQTLNFINKIVIIDHHGLLAVGFPDTLITGFETLWLCDPCFLAQS